MKTAVPISPKLFENIDGREHNNLLVECHEVLNRKDDEGKKIGTSYFGVGTTTAGTKNIISFL